MRNGEMRLGDIESPGLSYPVLLIGGLGAF